MRLLIRNGRIIDPANKLDQQQDVLVEKGKISKIAKDIKTKTDKVINVNNKIVIPGLIDMHVHLREPGREDKETVASGTRAALKGGVTTILSMPNTEPAIDCIDTVRLLQKIIKKSAHNNVLIAAAISKSRLGKELTNLPRLKKQGVCAISDDGASVDDADLFLQALKKAKRQGLLVIAHCEDRLLSKNGVVNRGVMSTRLGLRGIPRESESQRVERDIRLAEKAKAALHIAHVSCRESVELIAKAKKNNIKITAETAPQYFALNEEAVLGYDTNMKINPPLRERDDVAAIKKGLKNKTIDVIASDHAPHTENEKAIEFERAAFGTIGLETELAVAITELISPGLLDWEQLVAKFTCNPARILGIDKGTLGIGRDADIAIVDPQKEWTVERDQFLSKSKNSAFLGRRLKGSIEYTICGGEIVYRA